MSNYTYPTTNVPPWTATDTIWPTSPAGYVTHQPTLNPTMVETALKQVQAQLWETQRQLHQITAQQQDLMEMLDWLTHNPGKTTADWGKFKAVKSQLADALSREIHAQQNSTGI